MKAKKKTVAKIVKSFKKRPGRKPGPRPSRQLSAAALAVRRAYQRNRNLGITAKGQDIGELPPCLNPRRRKKAIASFKFFCDTYFSQIFSLPWSSDLLKVCAKVEQAVVNHDKLLILMPRGSGKSSICRCAVLWASLSGRHPYVKYIGAVVNDATKALRWFKDELAENDLLCEDWPEVCVPIRRLDNEPRRCTGQRYQGEKTQIQWGKNLIVLPRIPESIASQFVIEPNSMEGNVKGSWIRIEGKVIRPTLAIIDDPQTSESSRSQGVDGQTMHRFQTINQDVQGLAGPTARTAMLLTITAVEPGDLAEKLFKDPKYHGEKMKRLYALPRNIDLWDKYREMRNLAMQGGVELAKETTEFYRQHMCDQGRKLDEPAAACAACKRRDVCMDADAVVDWAARIDDPRNLSAVQAAMHSLYDFGEAGFAAEFQNEPLLRADAAKLPTAAEICNQACGYDRGAVPGRAIHLTAFIDVGDDYMAWLVAAWESNFTGTVIDYGTWPDQGRTFSKATPRKSLSSLYPKAGVDGAIVAGLKDLSQRLMDRQFPQSGSTPMQIGLCLVDTGYKPDAVYSAIRMVRRGAALRPSRGRGISAGRTQFDDFRRDKCREMGLHWWIPKDSPQAVIQIDTNFWKTFVHSRLATSVGDPGALTLYGKPTDHRLLADHILSEYYTTPATEKGIQIQEWHQHVGRDNEFFDCLVGASVAAAKLGCLIVPGGRAVVRTQRRPQIPVINSSFNPELG